MKRRPIWHRNGYSRREWYRLSVLTRALLVALS